MLISKIFNCKFTNIFAVLKKFLEIFAIDNLILTTCATKFCSFLYEKQNLTY